MEEIEIGESTVLIPIRIPKEQKDDMIERLVAYFQEERLEIIGHLAAGQLLDHLMQEIGDRAEG